MEKMEYGKTMNLKKRFSLWLCQYFLATTLGFKVDDSKDLWKEYRQQNIKTHLLKVILRVDKDMLYVKNERSQDISEAL